MKSIKNLIFEINRKALPVCDRVQIVKNEVVASIAGRQHFVDGRSQHSLLDDKELQNTNLKIDNRFKATQKQITCFSQIRNFSFDLLAQLKASETHTHTICTNIISQC